MFLVFYISVLVFYILGLSILHFCFRILYLGSTNWSPQAPQEPRGVPRSAQEAPGGPRSRPAPRAPQERPEAPKSPQEGPQEDPEGPMRFMSCWHWHQNM